MLNDKDKRRFAIEPMLSSGSSKFAILRSTLTVSRLQQEHASLSVLQVAMRPGERFPSKSLPAQPKRLFEFCESSKVFCGKLC